MQPNIRLHIYLHIHLQIKLIKISINNRSQNSILLIINSPEMGCIMMGKRKIASVLLVVTLFVSFLSNAFIIGPLVMFGRAANDSEETDSSTTLNVTVLQDEPRVNWFDFQFNNSGSWESKLNQQIDVNNVNEYRFIVNISSDQGWDDIDYVFIEAWADLGNDTAGVNNYNNSGTGNIGGNINLNLTYDNSSGTAYWYLMWPDDEASKVDDDCWEWSNETDPAGAAGHTECYNLTFAFIPSYQFRYAPGNGGSGTRDDLWSWNFNITVVDAGGNLSYNNPTAGESVGEFGVFTYTEIMSVGWPVIVGAPGTTAIATDSGGSGNITLSARSNGNYSLDIDLDQLNHTTLGGAVANMSNTTVSVRGGNVSSPATFSGTAPVYLWGNSDGTPQWALNDTTSFDTTDIEYRIAIPLAQTPGDYSGTLHYHLVTEE